MSVPTLDLPVKAAAVQPISIARRIKNNIAATLFIFSFLIALVPLVWLLWVVIERGSYAIAQPGWWSHSLRGVLPEQFSGGVYHAIYGTLVQAAVAALLAIPLGFMTAVFLAEYRSNRLARFTSFMVDVLAGLPSIVAALDRHHWFRAECLCGFTRVGIADVANRGAID
jgi:phosphate transport system permease protein